MTGSTAPVVVIARTIGPRVTSAVTWRGSAGRRYQRTDAIRPTTMTPEAIAHWRSGRNISDRPPVGHHLGSYRRSSWRLACRLARGGSPWSAQFKAATTNRARIIPRSIGALLSILSHSVGALLAEQLAHLRMEVFHAGADGRRLLYLLGGQNGADLESGGEPLAHQGGTGLRFLLHQRIDILRRDGARAEQLVAERLLGRPLLRDERGEARLVRRQDVLHLLLLVGAQVECVQHAGPAQQRAVAAGAVSAHAVPERERAAGYRWREQARHENALRQWLRHGSSPCRCLSLRCRRHHPRRHRPRPRRRSPSHRHGERLQVGRASRESRAPAPPRRRPKGTPQTLGQATERRSRRLRALSERRRLW